MVQVEEAAGRGVPRFREQACLAPRARKEGRRLAVLLGGRPQGLLRNSSLYLLVEAFQGVWVQADAWILFVFGLDEQGARASCPLRACRGGCFNVENKQT